MFAAVVVFLITQNRCAQQELSVSIKVSKKLYYFNRHELRLLTYECDVKNDSIGLPESNKKF